MDITIAGRTLRKIGVIDDDESVREGYLENLEDIGFDPVQVSGPIGGIDELFTKSLDTCDAVVTDLSLKGTGYSPSDGGVIAVEGYKRHLPVLLCTEVTQVDLNVKLRRSQRRRVPAIVSPPLEEEKVIRGFTKALEEIGGKFSPDRKAWRTQVQVVDYDVDRKHMRLIVLGRDVEKPVGVFVDELPEDIQRKVQVGLILHVKANTGARSSDELYFDEWEPR